MQKEKINYTVSKYFTKTISSPFEKAEPTSLLKNHLAGNTFPRQLKKKKKVLLSYPYFGSLSSIVLYIIACFSGGSQRT